MYQDIIKNHELHYILPVWVLLNHYNILILLLLYCKLSGLLVVVVLLCLTQFIPTFSFDVRILWHPEELMVESVSRIHPGDWKTTWNHQSSNIWTVGLIFLFWCAVLFLSKHGTTDYCQICPLWLMFFPHHIGKEVFKRYDFKKIKIVLSFFFFLKKKKLSSW